MRIAFVIAFERAGGKIWNSELRLQESLKHSRGLMLSPPDSIAILQLLIKLTKARVAVEVGVFTGKAQH